MNIGYQHKGMISVPSCVPSCTNLWKIKWLYNNFRGPWISFLSVYFFDKSLHSRNTSWKKYNGAISWKSVTVYFAHTFSGGINNHRKESCAKFGGPESYIPVQSLIFSSSLLHLGHFLFTFFHMLWNLILSLLPLGLFNQFLSFLRGENSERGKKKHAYQLVNMHRYFIINLHRITP